MSETAELYQAMGDHRKALRAKYGVHCPECKKVRPRAHPSILLPQQRCRVDGYIDPRPELTEQQYRGDPPSTTAVADTTKTVFVLSAMGHYIAEMHSGRMRVGMRNGVHIDYEQGSPEALALTALHPRSFEEIDLECARMLATGEQQ